MSTNYTLLMTACIEPNPLNFKSDSIHRMNALIRLKDYENALVYWLTCSTVRLNGIVFIENSGFDLTPLKNLVAINNPQALDVEFLQQHASERPKGLHYGYSEIEMIDYAFKRSTLINQSDYIIKVTGRLYFPKLGKLLKRLPNGFDLAIDSRDYKFWKYRKSYVVTTIFVVSKKFYNTFLFNAKSQMVPGINSHIEKAYYKILKPLSFKNDNRIILRFPFSMNPIGIGAHGNVNYRSKKKLIESKIRDLTRIIFPNFWI
jgi:hypothetical protein